MEKGATSTFAMVVAMAVLAMVATTTAAQEFSDDEKALFLKLHNDARAAVGVGAVSWDETLAAKALEHASYCQKRHIPGPYGENLWWSDTTAGTTGTPADAMRYWLAEGQYYDHGSNTSSAGTDGHYTQVVWSRTTYVGCARVACNTSGTGTLIACNYYPRGNMNKESPY